MSQVDELQGRITAALDRIAQGLEARKEDGGSDAEDVTKLRQELEDERTVTAQLEERNKRLKDKLTDLEDRTAKSEEDRRAALKTLDDQLQSLRRANAQLRENNKALREANEAGVAEPHLINKSMMAELDGLRAAQAADHAEADAVMQELARLLESPKDAPNKENA
jgi:chromosome segregation ATPase